MGDKKNEKVFLKDIWPQERDFIFRPDRLKYVRRLKNEENCVFCKTASSSEPSPESLLLYKSAYSQIVLNKYPYNTGHLLVLPLQHGESLMNLGKEPYQDLMENIRFACRVLKKVYKVEGLNIGMNHGKVAGAGIPEHLHWHVIPRWFGDTNFFPVICETKVLPETLEQTWDRIFTVIKELKEGEGLGEN